MSTTIDLKKSTTEELNGYLVKAYRQRDTSLAGAQSAEEAIKILVGELDRRETKNETQDELIGTDK